MYLDLLDKAKSISYEIAAIDNLVKAIHENHQRIRSNLSVLQSQGDEKALRTRYINELAQDEELLRKHKEKKSALQANIDALHKEANNILLGISSEVDIPSTPK